MCWKGMSHQESGTIGLVDNLIKKFKMKTKKDIVKDWITRYSGIKIKSFGKFVLLTNFQKYVDEFAKINKVNVEGLDKNMPSATYDNITIIIKMICRKDYC